MRDHTTFQLFKERFESEHLARTIVEPLLNRPQVRIGDDAEIGLSWQVLAGQPVGIFVASSLLCAARICKIEIALQAGSNEPMISEACWLRRSSRLIVLGARGTAPAMARIDIQISYNACRRYRSARSRRRDDMGNSTWR
ncbi:hypothetical protein XAC3810_340041 [Xanthomonas citri pv. citri]|uniref:Uncharacterized protein n=1 Tax=Xanthomonas citri pv. citri TaxID=611301 RepID=A0A0U4YIS8_XANCI|nr:hypothetical protein XAC2911_1490030 [Xanthomonas citri pv. citri]CEE36442.1 hypothetical protein XAC3810_340041 [Xanthomonas citri pv. citri]CEE56183.1 hypothetical protein XACS584_1470013 [Xanthomonas citri pv. citri]CEE61620.1 hypothetical protein XAC3608_1940041 [Xanthomonas citri pv. citri]CEE77865.1 hypothetical protein XACLE20_1680029 [Xanthomonas citri pv. citri]